MKCNFCAALNDRREAYCADCGASLSAQKQPLAKKSLLPYILVACFALAVGLGTGISLFWFSRTDAPPASDPPMSILHTDDAGIADDPAPPAVPEIAEHMIPMPPQVRPAHPLQSETVLEANVRLAVATLLAQYTSLFTDISQMINEIFGDFTFDELDGPPPLEMLGLPYLRFWDTHSMMSAKVAQGFRVHDFNGVPLVDVRFMHLFANGPVHPVQLFLYDRHGDGGFTFSGEFHTPSFFTDSAGNLVILQMSWNIASFDRVTFEPGQVFARIAEFPLNDLHDRADLGVGFDFDNPVIPGIEDGDLTMLPRHFTFEEDLSEHFSAHLDALTEPLHNIPMPRSTPQPPPPQPAANTDFILQDSHVRLLDEGCIAHLDAAQLRIARNEIYARHGRRFRDEALQAHFDALPWYAPTLDFGIEPQLNAIEMQNVALILRHEDNLP